MPNKNLLNCLLLLFVLLGVLRPVAAHDPLNGDFTRDEATDIRIVSYNTERNLVDSSSTDDEFERILTTLDPDVIIFQEIITEVTTTQVKAKLDEWMPIGGDGWQMHRGTGSFIQNMLASRYPLSMLRTDTTPAAVSSGRGVTMALVDLPDSLYATDLYLMGVHLKCCSGSSEEESRQQSADAIIRWLWDARTVGGVVNLPDDTPMIVAGDFNLVGGFGNQPEQTLLTGDIQDEATFGPDQEADWDETDLLDLTPQDPFTNRTNTWPSGTSNPSSRLDRFLITDSVLNVVHSGIFNTHTMTSGVRAANGLNRGDNETAADHLPIYMDMRFEMFRGSFILLSDTTNCNQTIEVTLSDPNARGDAVMFIEAFSSVGDTEEVMLTEGAGGTGVFTGSFVVSALNNASTLQVADGGTVTLRYLDADAGGGESAVIDAVMQVDCAPPVIDDVTTITVETSRAEVSVATAETTDIVIEYGTTCANLAFSQAASAPGQSATIELPELLASTNYFYRVLATDTNGNTAIGDNGGACYTFRTLDRSEYYTERFLTDPFDLSNTTVAFRPTEMGYSVCRTPISNLPYSFGATSLTLDDDSFEQILLSGGRRFPFGETSYSSMYLGSNGYLTFEAGDDTPLSSLENHFDQPRLSFLFDDLEPAANALSYEQFNDRLIITGLDVSEYNSSNRSTFQIELVFDGTILIHYESVESEEIIVGLSFGDGVPPDYEDSPFSSLGECDVTPAFPSHWRMR